MSIKDFENNPRYKDGYWATAFLLRLLNFIGIKCIDKLSASNIHGFMFVMKKYR